MRYTLGQRTDQKNDSCLKDDDQDLIYFYKNEDGTVQLHMDQYRSDGSSCVKFDGLNFCPDFTIGPRLGDTHRHLVETTINGTKHYLIAPGSNKITGNQSLKLGLTTDKSQAENPNGDMTSPSFVYFSWKELPSKIDVNFSKNNFKLKTKDPNSDRCVINSDNYLKTKNNPEPDDCIEF